MNNLGNFNSRFGAHVRAARGLIDSARPVEDHSPILDRHGNPIVKIGTQFSGHFVARVSKENPITGEKEVVREMAFDNLITNNGLDHLGAFGTNVWTYCSVGTDNTPEAVGDTSLGGYVAHQGYNAAAVTSTTASSEPYYGRKRYEYNFGLGAAAGNLQEIGIGPSTGGTNLFSRSRIYDGASPLGATTLTVLADEYLDVFYELRCYPDHVGSPQGSGTIYVDDASPRATAAYTIRAAYVTNHSYLGDHTPDGANAAAVSFEYGEFYGPDSTLGALTGVPSSAASAQMTSTGGTTTALSTYSAGTYYRDVTYSVPLGEGNVAGSPLGFDCIRFNTTFGSYQMHVDHLWQKTASELFTFTVRLAWARKTI